MRCKTCHYSLANLTEHRCPECGNAFDPNDPSTYESVERLRARDRRVARALLRRLGIVWVLTCSSVVALAFFTGVDQLNLAETLFGGAICGSILTFLLLPLLLLMSDLKVRQAQMDFRNEPDG